MVNQLQAGVWETAVIQELIVPTEQQAWKCLRPGARGNQAPPAQHDGSRVGVHSKHLPRCARCSWALVNHRAGNEAAPRRQDTGFLMVRFAFVINERVFHMKLVELKQSLNQEMKRLLGAGTQACRPVRMQKQEVLCPASKGAWDEVLPKISSPVTVISLLMRTVPGEEGERHLDNPPYSFPWNRGQRGPGHGGI